MPTTAQRIVDRLRSSWSNAFDQLILDDAGTTMRSTSCWLGSPSWNHRITVSSTNSPDDTTDLDDELE